MAINAGDLRHRMTIKRKIETEPDMYGRRQVRYVPLCTVWAAIRDVSGREFWAASAVQMEQVVTITVRYRNDLRNDMRIIYGETTYEILQINHLGYTGDYIQIKARIVQAEESEGGAHGYA